MTGTVTKYNSETFTGIIEDAEGNIHLLKRNSFRRGTLLKVGDSVQFQSANLFDGPTAHDVVPQPDFKK